MHPKLPYAFTALLAFGACGEPPPAPTPKPAQQIVAPRPPTAAQIQAVRNVVIGAMLGDSAGGLMAPRAYRPAVAVEGGVNDATDCSLGGTIQSATSFSGDAQSAGSLTTAVLQVYMKLTPTDCMETDGETTVTINGAPNLVFTGQMDMELYDDGVTQSERATLTGDLVGKVVATSENVDDFECAFDMAMVVDYENGEASGTAKGDACGDKVELLDLTAESAPSMSRAGAVPLGRFRP